MKRTTTWRSTFNTGLDEPMAASLFILEQTPMYYSPAFKQPPFTPANFCTALEESSSHSVLNPQLHCYAGCTCHRLWLTCLLPRCGADVFDGSSPVPVAEYAGWDRDGCLESCEGYRLCLLVCLLFGTRCSALCCTSISSRSC